MKKMLGVREDAVVFEVNNIQYLISADIIEQTKNMSFKYRVYTGYDKDPNTYEHNGGIVEFIESIINNMRKEAIRDTKASIRKVLFD